MITPSFGLTATERVLPKLALDFTTASLDNRVTFTRTGNTATVVNSLGYITGVNADLPRFDFNPVTLACKGLLIEEARTNLFPTSENPTWALSSEVTTSNNASTGPDNTTSAQGITPTTNSAAHYTEENTAFPATGNYAYSVFLKANGYNFALLQLSFIGNNGRAVFNLSNGTVSSSVNATATVEPFANGFYKCTIVVNVTNTSSPAQRLYVYSTATTSTFAGDGTSGIYMYGRQLEAGAFATSYIPTEATAVTRNADVATMTGTNFSDWFNPTEGTFGIVNSYLGFSATDRFTLMVSSNPSAFGVNSITTRTFNTTQATTIFDGGAVGVNLNNTGTVANTIYNTVMAYKENNFGISRNASSVALDTSCTIPTVAALYIGGSGGATNVMCGHVQKINYWPQRLINAEVQAFSK
jgi:hypothetical protein